MGARKEIGAWLEGRLITKQPWGIIVRSSSLMSLKVCVDLIRQFIDVISFFATLVTLAFLKSLLNVSMFSLTLHKFSSKTHLQSSFI